MRILAFVVALLCALPVHAQQRQQPRPVQAPDLEGRTPPPAQEAFMQIVRTYRERSTIAINDVARMAVRWDRSAEIRRNPPTPAGWIGRVNAIYVVPGGFGGLSIALPDGTVLGTPSARIPATPDAPIGPNSPAFSALLQIKEGDFVRFDAVMYCHEVDGKEDCPLDIRPDHRAALEQPRFLVRFTGLRPVR
jgi:hypothetical protein